MTALDPIAIRSACSHPCVTSLSTNGKPQSLWSGGQAAQWQFASTGGGEAGSGRGGGGPQSNRERRRADREAPTPGRRGARGRAGRRPWGRPKAGGLSPSPGASKRGAGQRREAGRGSPSAAPPIPPAPWGAAPPPGGLRSHPPRPSRGWTTNPISLGLRIPSSSPPCLLSCCRGEPQSEATPLPPRLPFLKKGTSEINASPSKMKACLEGGGC